MTVKKYGEHHCVMCIGTKSLWLSQLKHLMGGGGNNVE